MAMTSRSLDLPFCIGCLGVPRLSEGATLARQRLEQLLFTMPGERVNLPEFGIGVQRLVFGPASPEVAVALEYSIRVAAQRYLADTLVVDAVRVAVEDATLVIDILFTLKETGEELGETFRKPLEGTP